MQKSIAVRLNVEDLANLVAKYMTDEYGYLGYVEDTTLTAESREGPLISNLEAVLLTLIYESESMENR